MTPVPLMYYDLPPDSGYSVDNLAPWLTGALPACRTFHRPVSAYRGTRMKLLTFRITTCIEEIWTNSCPPGSNLLGTTSDTTLLDPAWHPADSYFYKLVAVDVHGNRSPAALLRPQDIKVGTMLQNFSASLVQSGIEIAWKLSEVGVDVRVDVLRAETPGGIFEELAAPEIVRDGFDILADRQKLRAGDSVSLPRRRPG